MMDCCVKRTDFYTFFLSLVADNWKVRLFTEEQSATWSRSTDELTLDNQMLDLLRLLMVSSRKKQRVVFRRMAKMTKTNSTEFRVKNGQHSYFIFNNFINRYLRRITQVGTIKISFTIL